MKIKTLVTGPSQNNTYIVYDDNKNAVIIDPAFESFKTSAFIDENSLKVKYIFLTHGHYDHFYTAKKLKQQYSCPLVIHKDDAMFLTSPELSLVGLLHTSDDVYVKADMEIKNNDKITVGEMEFTFLHTPGHTPGGCCILIDDTMFSGDTVFYGTVGNCALPLGDFNTLMSSIKNIIIPLAIDYKILPGHSEPTTLNAEKMNNEYFNI